MWKVKKQKDLKKKTNLDFGNGTRWVEQAEGSLESVSGDQAHRERWPEMYSC